MINIDHDTLLVSTTQNTIPQYNIKEYDGGTRRNINLLRKTKSSKNS